MAGETNPTTLAALVDKFVASLRPDQMQRIVSELSPDQEKLFTTLLEDLGLKVPGRAP